MGPICPECQTGKHRNCDGIGLVTDTDVLACTCMDFDHPNRTHFKAEALE